MSLCWRCQHRVEAHETGVGSRYECTNFKISVFACYMYQPTKPAILKRLNGDRRPQFGGWIFSSRSQFGGEPEDLVLSVDDYKRKGKALRWVRES